MDIPETLATLGTQDGDKQTQKQKQKQETKTHKTKLMNNTDFTKIRWTQLSRGEGCDLISRFNPRHMRVPVPC